MARDSTDVEHRAGSPNNAAGQETWQIVGKAAPDAAEQEHRKA